MTDEKKKMTAHGSSVGADDGQSISTNSKFTIPDPEEKSNSPERDLEELYRKMRRMSDPAYLHNAAIIRKMVEAQGYVISENGGLSLPDGILPEMKIPSDLVPHCPKCGKPMSMNLRSDDTFVEDEGWHRAAQRYSDFLRKHQNMRVLFLEAAVGFNTPVIIKYPFWRMTAQNRRAVYACVNLGEAWAPREIAESAICLDGDIGEVLKKLK